ncbi:unnamed protein product, partial [Rotaria sp. Silwood2]
SEEQCKTTKKNIEESSSIAKSSSDLQHVNSRKNSSNSMVKSSSTATSGTLVSLPTSSSISFQPTTTSARRTKPSTQSPTSKKSTSSNDSTSESRLFLYEDSSDKNGVEIDEINNLETRNMNSVENDSEVGSEDDDSLEKPTKNIYFSVKDTSLMNKNKRSFDEVDEQPMLTAIQPNKVQAPEVKKKRVSQSTYNALMQQKNALSKQVERYKSTWMPRPTDAKTIKFFIEMGRLLAGGIDEDQKNVEDDKGDLLERYCTILNLEPDEVEECTSTDSATKCCRLLVSKLVPKHKRIGESWKNVASNKQRTVLALARMFHPSERRTDGELTKACRNVFEVAKSSLRKQKRTVEESNENTDSSDDN